MVLLELLLIGWALYQFASLFESRPDSEEPDDLDLFLAQVLSEEDEEYEDDEENEEEEDTFDWGFTDSPQKRYHAAFVGSNLVSAEDMERLHDSGYDPLDVEFMDSGELKEAMEDAGVDTWMYDFDD